MPTTVNGDSVEVELRVGMLDLALAKLMTEDHHTIEFPTILLPENVEAGSIIKLQCSRALKTEKADQEKFESVQKELLSDFAVNLPKTPVLRARNVTQTSVVLEWDPIEIATADLHFMALYKGTQRLGVIPQPLKRTVTKVSNLEIDSPYDFHLVLSTSAGDFESNNLDVKTHKMTDLTGVVVCIGSLSHSAISEPELETTLKILGCKPPQHAVKLDTTHFICSTEGGAGYERASELNIPIVRPEWLKACETERRLVSVRGYYLSEMPKVSQSVHQPAAASAQTEQTGQEESESRPADGHSRSSQETPEVPGPSQASPEQTETSAEEPAGGLSDNGAPTEHPNSENASAEPEASPNLNDKSDIAEADRTSDTADQGAVDSDRTNDEKIITQDTPVPNNTAPHDEIPLDEVPLEQPAEPSNNGLSEQAHDTLASDSHDELSSAINNVANEHEVEELDAQGQALHEKLQWHLNESAEPTQSVDEVGEEQSTAEVATGRELEKELEGDPSAELREGEQQRVTLEEAQPVDPQSADIADAKIAGSSGDESTPSAPTKKTKKNKKKNKK